MTVRSSSWCRWWARVLVRVWVGEWVIVGELMHAESGRLTTAEEGS